MIAQTVIAAWLLTACAGPAPSAPPTPVGITAEPTPTAVILDDFEAATTAWQAAPPARYLDSAAAAVALTPGRGSGQALALTFDAPTTARPKAIFLLERPFDLSAAAYLAFDIENAGAAAGVALALSTGAAWTWYESLTAPLESGWRTVAFDLASKHYKTEARQWKADAALDDLARTQRVAIVIFPRTAGRVTLDNLRLAAAPDANAILPTLDGAPGLITASPPTVTPRPAATLTLQAPQGPAAVNRPLEALIETDGVVENPFDPAQFDLWVRFTSPTGHIITAPAFYGQEFDPRTLEPSGAAGWRVRFTPPEAGEWHAQAELASPSLRSAAVAFTVNTAPAGRGFVRVDRTNPRYFSFDNGGLYLPIGLNLAWASGQNLVVLDDYTRWFDALSANGGNIARVWMASWSFALEWKDTGLGDYTARLRQAWLLDRVLQLADERGIYVMLTLLNHGAFNTTLNPEWDDNPYNVINGGMLAAPQDFATDPEARRLFKRRLRYIAARYAAAPSLFAWEWWNEVNWTPIGDALLGPWMDEMNQTLRAHDPYRHLVSVSYANGGATRLWARPDVSFAQQHDYSGRDPFLEFRAAYDSISATAGAKPLLMAEHGYSPGGAAVEFGREAIHLHNGVWTPVFMGYAGSGMAWWWDTLIAPANLWSVYKPLALFMAGEDVRTLTAAAPQTTDQAYLLALQGPERALVWMRNREYDANAAARGYEKALKAKTAGPGWQYEPPIVSGLTFTLTNLSEANYTARWFDAQTGQWLSEQSLRMMGGALTLTAPEFSRDLAVKIVRRE